MMMGSGGMGQLQMGQGMPMMNLQQSTFKFNSANDEPSYAAQYDADSPRRKKPPPKKFRRFPTVEFQSSA